MKKTAVGRMKPYFKLFLPTIAIAAIFAAMATAQETDRQREGLKGPVKIIDSESRDEPASRGRAHQMDKVSYDSDGKEVERIIYDDYGFLGGKEVRTYNSAGMLVRSVLSDENGTVLEDQAYGYKDGQLTEVSASDSKGRISMKTALTYNEMKLLSEEIYFVPSARKGRTVYSYDSKKRLTEVAFYLADGREAVAPIGPCLGAHRVGYAYDNKGRVIRKVAFESDGKLKVTWTYSYGPAGEVVESVKYDEYGQVKYSFAYNYDSRGNWVKKVVTSNTSYKIGPGLSDHARVQEVTRKIEYYDQPATSKSRS